MKPVRNTINDVGAWELAEAIKVGTYLIFSRNRSNYLNLLKSS